MKTPDEKFKAIQRIFNQFDKKQKPCKKQEEI
jgi:hypothetical protein